MTPQIFHRAVLAHISFQQVNVRFSQIDYDQAIQRIRKLGIYIESKKLRPEPGILTQQDGRAFSVRFHVGDQVGKIVE